MSSDSGAAGPGPRRLLPSHAVLRSFECAARHQSFTLAAHELNLTQSAVSRQVKDLETAIGTALFRRTGRQVVLTEAGANLALDLAGDLENIHQTVLRAMAAGDQGTALRLAVLPTFASRWLIPKLAGFYAHNSNVTLNLSTRLKPFDLVKERFDIAIHFGADSWPDARLTRLFGEVMVPVCAPEFRERYPISNAQQLSDAPLLHLETRPQAWSDWFASAGMSDRPARSGQHFDQFSMLIAGSLASLGAALIPEYMIENELKSGQLIRLSDTVLTTKNSYFVVTPAGSTRPQVASFTRWIRAAASPRQQP